MSLVHSFGLDICCFVETRLDAPLFARIQCSTGPQWDHYVIPAEGRSGGIVVIWQKGVGQLTFTHQDRQVCFGLFSPPTAPPWILGVMYASTNGIHRKLLWDSIIHVSSLGLPLLLLGDFIFL